MAKLKHTVQAVTSATLATALQAAGATVTTTTTTNCPKAGLAYTTRKDPRTVTTTAAPNTTGGTGTIPVTVVNDNEASVA